MKSFLRRALENEKPDEERPVVISGPLSDAITQALNTKYAKNQDGDNKVATESQAMDDHAMRQLAEMIAPATPEQTDAVRVYGVSRADIEDQDIVDITEELVNTPSDQRDDFVVVLDGTGDGGSGEGSEAEERIMALEGLMKAFRCRVYPSLEAFAEARYG
jgi:hypothetical protein